MFLSTERPTGETLTDHPTPHTTLFLYKIQGLPAAVEPKSKVAVADKLGGVPAVGGADLRIAVRPAEARARLLSEVLVRVVAVITILLCHAPEGGPDRKSVV